MRATRQCVIAIPGVDLATCVVEIGNCTGAKVDKFKAFKLTPRPAMKVTTPLVAECLANLECRLVDTTLAKKYGFLVLKVVQAWIDPTRKELRTFHAGSSRSLPQSARIGHIIRDKALCVR